MRNESGSRLPVARVFDFESFERGPQRADDGVRHVVSSVGAGRIRARQDEERGRLGDDETPHVRRAEHPDAVALDAHLQMQALEPRDDVAQAGASVLALPPRLATLGNLGPFPPEGHHRRSLCQCMCRAA